MARSLLSQLLQVEASVSYLDNVSGAHTQPVAEGQLELEGDLNVLRTLVKDAQGVTNWYDAPDMTLNGVSGKFFIQLTGMSGFAGVSVSGGSTTNFDTAIKTIPNHNAGAGNSTTEGVVVNGTRAAQLALRDNATKDPITDGADNVVYGRLTYGGGTYTVTFYSLQNNVQVPYSFSPAKSIDLACVLVSRTYANMGWDRFLDFEWYDMAGAVGTLSDSNVSVSGMNYLYDTLTTQHAINLKGDELGHVDTAGSGAHLISIDDTATGSDGYYTGVDVMAALSEVATQLGGDTSTTYNFTGGTGALLTDDDAVYAALNKLDQGWVNLKLPNTPGSGAVLVGIADAGGFTSQVDVEGALQEIYQALQDQSVSKTYQDSVATLAGANLTVPSYKVSADGSNMDVYYSGQLLRFGASYDYVESGTVGSQSTVIKPTFDMPSSKNLAIFVRS